MDIKRFLKNIKVNESTISMVLGVLVVLLAGALVYRYFNRMTNDVTVPAVSTEQTDDGVRYDEEGREIYTVNQGDSLWSIAETKLGSGYEWTKIADLNDLSGNYELSSGQELVLPATTEEKLADASTDEPEATAEPELETEEESVEEETVEEEHAQMEHEHETTTEESSENEIEGDRYTVVRGDSLWSIAERAYGDGFRWKDIAEANDLANPSIIHAGNEFVLPR